MGSQRLVLQCEWKENWNETKERFTKWWNRLVIDGWFETTRAHNNETLVRYRLARVFYFIKKKPQYFYHGFSYASKNINYH